MEFPTKYCVIPIWRQLITNWLLLFSHTEQLKIDATTVPTLFDIIIINIYVTIQAIWG